MHISLNHVDRLYSTCAGARFYPLGVSHSAFRMFSRKRWKFLKQLADSVRDPYWGEYIRFVSRFGFRSMTAPLPFDHPSIFSASDVERLTQTLNMCEPLYPGMSADAFSLLEQIQTLAASRQNPLLDAMWDFVPDLLSPKETALVLKDSRLLEAVEGIIHRDGSQNGWHTVTPTHLRGQLYERMILFGPASWFPEYLFTAPRAKEAYIVHYDWSIGVRDVQSVFGGASVDKIRFNPIRTSSSVAEVEDELFERPGFTEINRYAGDGSHDNSGEDCATVNARLILLEGANAVFLESAATTLVIDLEGHGRKVVVRKAVANIDAGMFLLLKQGGGGDYIVGVADSILGTNAMPFRTAQRRWKHLLRDFVDLNGLQQTVRFLYNQGAQRANDWNIRNWMSDSSIRPWDYRDFAAVMRVVGLAAQADEYWAIMGEIDAAHMRAGQAIRRALLNQVSKSDLTTLDRVGRLDFTVNIASGVRMTAYRIAKVLREPCIVSTTRLARLFQLEEWQAWPG